MRQSEQADAGGPGSRSENRDPVGVSAKGRDVLLHPAESLDLVQKAVVPFSCLVTCAEKACSQGEVPLQTVASNEEDEEEEDGGKKKLLGENRANNVKIMR